MNESINRNVKELRLVQTEECPFDTELILNGIQNLDLYKTVYFLVHLYDNHLFDKLITIPAKLTHTLKRKWELPICPKVKNDTEPCEEDEPKKSKNQLYSLLSFEIPISRIQIEHKIGSGSHGVVYQGTDFNHGLVAVKTFSLKHPTLDQIKSFRNEVAILKSTRHEHILSFIGCFLSDQLAIVTEWCPGLSLFKHLHVEEVVWSMGQLLDIAKQTAIGMEYLHAKEILHRDLKSKNIFLIPTLTQKSNKWKVKIGDFGLARVKGTLKQDTNRQPTGSIQWMSPEVIQQKIQDPYTQMSDVYSYGVVLYELMSGNLPFRNLEQSMILYLVGSGRLKLDIDECRQDTPDKIKRLIKVCIEYDRTKRPLFSQVKEILN